MAFAWMVRETLLHIDDARATLILSDDADTAKLLGVSPERSFPHALLALGLHGGEYQVSLSNSGRVTTRTLYFRRREFVHLPSTSEELIQAMNARGVCEIAAFFVEKARTLSRSV